MKVIQYLKRKFTEDIEVIKKLWVGVRSCSLEDWFCNPCEFRGVPVRKLLEIIVPEQTRECWCCSHVRGLFYGFITGVALTIAVVQLLR